MNRYMLTCVVSLGLPFSTAFADCEITEWGGVDPACLVIDNDLGKITLKCRGLEYKFHALDGQTLCDINEIVLAQTLTGTGDITVLVGRGASGSTPGPTEGARHLKKVDISRAGETGVISGIRITGNFLELGAMSIDQVTGDIIVGSGTGDLLNDMTINAALSNQVAIAGNAEGKITVNGHLYDTISVGGDLSQPIEVTGVLDAEITVNGRGA